jgi:hypothetical protein
VLQPVDDLVVDDVEAHRRQRHPRHDVNRAEPYRGVGVVVPEGVGARHHVPEPDRRQTHEAEVEAVEERPVFQFVQGERPQADVDEHHGQAEKNGGQDAESVHRRLRLVVGAAEAVHFFDGAVAQRRVQAVVNGVRSDVERLLEGHLLLHLELLTLLLHPTLLLRHALLVVAAVAAVGAQAAAEGAREHPSGHAAQDRADARQVQQGQGDAQHGVAHGDGLAEGGPRGYASVSCKKKKFCVSLLILMGLSQ